jgi:hypothetical protein
MAVGRWRVVETGYLRDEQGHTAEDDHEARQPE